jgi:hypothetical protein
MLPGPPAMERGRHAEVLGNTPRMPGAAGVATILAAAQSLACSGPNQSSVLPGMGAAVSWPAAPVLG